jgi:hypothetical protein
MDVLVIGFLRVFLTRGRSTVKLHGSLRSRCACSQAGFSSQNGDRAWGLYHRTTGSVVRFFLWAKGLTAKDIHKKRFPVYGVKCLSRKAVHNWVANITMMTKRLKRKEVAETTVKRLLCCRFRRTGKAIGQVYQCWLRNECFSQVRISHVLRSTSICGLFTDSYHVLLSDKGGAMAEWRGDFS